MEADNIAPDVLQRDYCGGGAKEPFVTFAGLRMRYDDTGVHGTVRDWVFITDKGTVYQLQANDGYNASDARKARLTSILSTFRAEYTTWGCA